MSARWQGTPSTGRRFRADSSKRPSSRRRTAPPMRPLRPVISTFMAHKTRPRSRAAPVPRVPPLAAAPHPALPLTAMATMLRAAKHDGVGNVVVERVEVPRPGEGEVLVRLQASLISRGSEIGGRYLSETAVDPSRMGYSAAGVVAEAGPGVDDPAPGDRVVVSAPHAEYVIGQAGAPPTRPSITPLPDEVGFEAATFLPLTTSSLAWADSAMIGPRDSVVILGQGLVGSILLQVVRQRQTGRLVAVDGLERRCRLAGRIADDVVDCSRQDPVEAVRRLCPGGRMWSSTASAAAPGCSPSPRPRRCAPTAA